VAGSVPTTASAFVVGGRPWPAATISYFVAAPGYSGAVGRAARAWNRAKVGVRFVRASRSSADVIVADGGAPCGGETPVGFGGWRVSTVIQLGAGCNKGFIELTAVHEFGHVLGLDHEPSKCARMNASFTVTGTPSQCRGHSLKYWLAHPLEPDDINGARYLYS
jgi:Astacin (Peptidase family M12A)